MLRVPCGEVTGPLLLEGRMKSNTQGPVEVFWATKSAPDFGRNGSLRVTIPGDGQWHPFRIALRSPGQYTAIRFDPCTKPGVVEIDEVRLTRQELHPLQFESFSGNTGRIRNLSDRDHEFRMRPQGPSFRAPAGGHADFSVPVMWSGLFSRFELSAQADGLPPLSRVLHLHSEAHDLGGAETLGTSNALIQVAANGTGARLYRRGQLVAVASPLAERDGQAVRFSGVLRRDGRIELAGEGGIVLAISMDGEDVTFDLQAPVRVAGPSVRAQGAMYQGLLAGVEYLGHGETSSSRLDLEREEHLRFEPDPMWITIPLAAYVTDRGSIAMLWNDMALQPVFATPNLFDNTPDHLMRLKGTNLAFRLRLGASFGEGGRLEDAVLWAVHKRGLAETPPAPRSHEAQLAFCRAAFDGALRTTNGWYHATWEGQPQHFFVDHASTVFRLDGRMPEVPGLVNNGAHVANPTAWLASGRASEWLAHLKHDAEQVRREQQPDGSFRYTGKFQRGHFDTTASGYCAIKAMPLLDHAFYTGDATSREAGLKALDFMRRFVTPRGAQIWEIPLHTPDILAAAKCCMAYLRGYALTGNAEYLELARRWAVRGLPFVYQWGNQPVMSYGSIAVLGATDWTGVVWIGLPVQWCGSVYAYALTELAPLDQTVDWTRVARGLLHCAEQMQYPDGPYAGTLPDSFNLADQRRLPAYVNPCVLVALRLRLAGKQDALAVATDGPHRVVAPFPVRIESGKAFVDAPVGLKYQVVIDGSRIVAVDGPTSVPLIP